MASNAHRQQHKYLDRSDGRLHYLQIGSGDPLVLVHDDLGTSWIWERATPYWTEQFTCYNVDLPGYGESDTPDHSYAVQNYTAAILDMLDHEGIERADIVGYHMGALVAFDLAHSHPTRVRKLVFEGLPFWDLVGGQKVWELALLPSFTDHDSFDVPVLPFTSWEGAAKQDSALDHALWAHREELKGKSRRWIHDAMKAITSYDVRAVAPGVTAPVLLINGEHDPMLRGAERALQAFPNCLSHLLPGAKRPHHERPEMFALEVLRFLWDDSTPAA